MWEGVLVVEVERLARGDTIDQGIMAQTFKYSGTKIVTPLKVYDPNNEYDEEYFEFGLFMSRREYKTINRRLQRGRLASAKEGKWVSGVAPYGYERVRVPNDKGWTLRPVEAEADIVRFIFRLYTSGEEEDGGSVKRAGTYSLALRLDNMGVAPPGGASYWSSTTIQQILQNPVYIGKIRWNVHKSKKRIINSAVRVERYTAPPEEQILVDGLHPAIVDEARAASRKNIVPKVEKLLEVYAALPSAQAKNEMLKEVIERAEYVKLSRTGKKGPFDNFELVLFPQAPPHYRGINKAAQKELGGFSL